MYDGQTVEADAEIRWSKPKSAKKGYALGLEFVSMDTKNQKRLHRFLEEIENTLGM